MEHEPNFPFKTVKDMPDVRGMRVIVRASLNVPVGSEGILDDFRITAAVETITYLKERGARVIILAHIGRNPEESLQPVYTLLEERFPLIWADDLLGDRVSEAVSALGDGEVLMLENVRSDPREVLNDDGFAQELASLGELFVNDAFADSHREHTSIVGIPAHLPSYAGLLFVREYTELKKAMQPEHPSLFILGGAKFNTKLPLVEQYIAHYDRIFVGGAIANDFFKGLGYEVGTSKISDADLSASPLIHNERIMLPVDVVVKGTSGTSTKSVTEVGVDEAMLDAGPETLHALAPLIASAKTILWNGTLGNYENGFEEGTNALAALIADAQGTSFVGGGDTVAMIDKLGRIGDFDFVSTAGGAMLTFLETGTLAGIEALRAGNKYFFKPNS